MKGERKLADDHQIGESESNTEEGLRSDSHSNDGENDPDKMEVMEDNGSEDGNNNQDEGSMETTRNILAEGKGRNVICSSFKNDL